ncbi:hypothetical protein [Nocardia miyunensis]|uniref:hypothetical protein n=1 Tax=Nocardia miyunensis TaxID=282684 RepID=UPI0012F5003C|nr:hypothetical protein [Nocardia miyunensis]
MRFAVTISPPKEYIHREAFREVAETVNWGLIRLGYGSVLADDLSLPNRTHIIFGSNTMAWWGLEAPEGAILYNLEQIIPGEGWATDWLLDMFRRHVVWDYSRHNIETLATLGVTNVRHVPIGSAPEMERIPPAETQDIDVLFIGSPNRRRAWIIEQLRAAGVNAQAHCNVYGKARDALYARAKIVLNIHFGPRIFEIVRISYLLTNSIFVISEDCVDAAATEEFADAIEFVDYDELVGTCLRYLADPAARAARAEKGLELMRGRPVERYLHTALQSPSELSGIGRD